MAQNRRTFLKTAGMAAAITSAAPLALSLQGAVPGAVSPAAAAQPVRAFSAGHFVLELGGAIAGVLNSYSGGFPYGEVIEFRDGGAPTFAEKMISGIAYEDISIQVTTGMAPVFWEWVAAMVSGDAVAKSGAIILADFNYETKARLEFHNALIREVSFPAGDASSKDPAYMTVVISPESTEYKPATGKATPSLSKQKKWVVSNFRVSVGDLPSARVSKVDALVVKQQITEFASGGDRIVVREPGKIEYPNLVLYIPEADTGPWLDFFNEFVLDGNNSPAHEKSGALTFLAPDLSSELMRLEFSNLGIFKCAPEKTEANADNVARFAAEMYMEGMTFLPAVQ